MIKLVLSAQWIFKAGFCLCLILTGRCLAVSPLLLICTSLMTINDDHFFRSSLAILISSLGKGLYSNILLIIKMSCGYFLLMTCRIFRSISHFKLDFEYDTGRGISTLNGKDHSFLNHFPSVLDSVARINSPEHKFDPTILLPHWK